jgi:LysR family transcriptional regulator, glycine cleavage system transcriptional activator
VGRDKRCISISLQQLPKRRMVGVALLPTFLIEDELAGGRLVRALNLPMESLEQYYLVWPPERSTHPPLVAFREWLLAETAADR